MAVDRLACASAAFAKKHDAELTVLLYAASKTSAVLHNRDVLRRLTGCWPEKNLLIYDKQARLQLRMNAKRQSEVWFYMRNILGTTSVVRYLSI